ncbi:MAG TPA: NAD(P)-dependent oxidoreductase [Terriglobia bacterium]|nr:NAD(P)-dependent oxidoreductase [Terriglobia bacterium]
MTQSNPQGSAGTTQRESRFLITGAKGFIGVWIVKNLVERGDRPWIFDLDHKSHRLDMLLRRDQLDRVGLIPGDIRRVEDVDRAVAEHGITNIIHLAALQVPACAQNPPLGAEVNVGGTLNVFEVAKRRRDTVRHIVYASSAAVFGPEEFYGGAAVKEGAQLRPGTHYGVFKECNEGNARVYYAQDGISSSGLRPWAVYGAGRDQGLTSAPTKAIKAIVVARPYAIHFTGAFDLQYVNDTARIFIRCSEAGLEGARVYSLRGSVVDMEDFLATLQKLHPAALQLIRAEGNRLPIAPDLDDSALVRDLGDLPRTSLEAGIGETLRIFQQLQAENRLDTADLETP